MCRRPRIPRDLREMDGNIREQRIADHSLARIVDRWVDLDDVGHVVGYQEQGVFCIEINAL